MLTVITLILSHLAVGAAGIFAGPKLEAWFASLAAGKALKSAQAIVAKAEADAKALAAARAAIVAAHVATGATGPTGA